MISTTLQMFAKAAAAVSKGHSHSKRINLQKPGGSSAAREHMGRTGNAQTPFRYGRKLTQKPVFESRKEISRAK